MDEKTQFSGIIQEILLNASLAENNGH